ncbi:hypothetical protein ACFL4H_00305 [Candidatus Neomarinimicrobiota bacterium]
MKLTITILPKDNQVASCDMCKKVKPEYEYVSAMARTHLAICHHCAIREYYGTKRSKRLQVDQNNDNLFGIGINKGGKK